MSLPNRVDNIILKCFTHAQRSEHSHLTSAVGKTYALLFPNFYCCFYMYPVQFNLFGSFPPHAFCAIDSLSSITSALMTLIRVLILTSERLHLLQMALDEKPTPFKDTDFIGEKSNALVYRVR